MKIKNAMGFALIDSDGDELETCTDIDAAWTEAVRVLREVWPCWGELTLVVLDDEGAATPLLRFWRGGPPGSGVVCWGIVHVPWVRGRVPAPTA